MTNLKCKETKTGRIWYIEIGGLGTEEIAAYIKRFMEECKKNA